MYYTRNIEKAVKRYRAFPVIVILGPRQSGKTTLARHSFKRHTYISFEKPSEREFAATDPEGFLRNYDNKHGIILDEFQYVPELLSYIQLNVDEHKRPGYFVLTGSQNFLVNQSISQSLAGRAGILTLLPFSIDELKRNRLIQPDSAAIETIYHGAYPRSYADAIAPSDFYPSYINTYVERDVRQLINVGNLNTFQKFLSLCAGRIGQLLNLSDIAVSCGISTPTANQWLSLLEASYIVFRLQPHFTNFNKRVTKTPKLYFYDTGLACSLLQIINAQTLMLSPFRGNLFENLIVVDLMKQFFNNGHRPSLYFWRDKNGTLEVDCMIEIAHNLTPIEIKAGQTIVPAFFKNLMKINEISSISQAHNYVIYAGEGRQKRTKATVLGWQAQSRLIARLYENSGLL